VFLIFKAEIHQFTFPNTCPPILMADSLGTRGIKYQALPKQRLAPKLCLGA